MKNEKFNFKDLKGTLSRDEMKKIKGGDYVFCTDCGPLSPQTCYDKYCICGPQCWYQSSTNQLCQCCGAGC